MVRSFNSGLVDFNPRAYVRHDEALRQRAAVLVFQSTCLREARRYPNERLILVEISIHVPT